MSYPYSPSEPPTGGRYPIDPVTGAPVSVDPVTGAPLAAPPKRRNKTLIVWVSVCAALAALVAGTYLYFFGGSSPTQTVEDYLELAATGDFAAARELTCADAEPAIRFEGESGVMDVQREFFAALDWKVLDEETSGADSVVVVDRRADAIGHDNAHYTLERDGGTWLVCDLTTVRLSNVEVQAGDCVDQYSGQPLDCYDADAYSVYDDVTSIADCPNDDEVRYLKDASGDLFCLMPSQFASNE